MDFVLMLRRQWEGYPLYHASKFNLLLHLVAVPAFLVANVALVICLAQGKLGGATISLVTMVLSAAAQGRGHSKEANPAIPFSGPMDAVARLLLEQWVSFPRFVLSGLWFRAYRIAPNKSFQADPPRGSA
jgi:hypothetical protein